MIPLLQGVKLEKPKSFTSVIDANAVNAFIPQVEQYFTLTNMVDANKHAGFALMLLIGNTAI